MANVFITEYFALGSQQFGPIQAPQEPTFTAYSFAAGASSTPSGTVFNNQTGLIEVHVDGPVCIAIGVSPVAVTTARRMAVNQTKYLTIPRGAQYTIAAINTV